MRRSVAGFAVLCLVGGSSIALGASAAQATPLPPPPAPVCVGATCTTTYGLTSGLQSFVVPNGITSVQASVSGGSGGNFTVGGGPLASGGLGGTSGGTLTVAGGDTLTVVVGAAGGSRDEVSGPNAGAAGGGGGYGGGGNGGAGSSTGSAGGGGGSFLFGNDGSLLLAAGGGGGADGMSGGGSGGGAGAAATVGTAGTDGATGGQPGTTADGDGGAGASTGVNAGTAGNDGTGSATSPAVLPTGGAGGSSGSDEEPGAGGGGGYFAGGGGGSDNNVGADSGGGGGGGAGFAAAGVTSPSGSAGAQSGDGSATITYTRLTQTIDLTSTVPASPVVGQTYPVTATSGSGDAVAFSIDASTTANCSINGATVTFTNPGTCTIDANQAGDTTYQAAPQVQQTTTVVQAATTTAVTVQPKTITATVTPVAPGAGTPTGEVQFSVDGDSVGSEVDLDNGVATLTYTVPHDKTQQVGAHYLGDNNDFIASTGTVNRQNPKITTSLSSAKHKTRFGWYRTPVTVTFHCTVTSAPLAHGCPGPVKFSRSAAHHSVSRTVVATDGGSATAVASGINVDRVKPIATVVGVVSGDTYASARHLRCKAHDTLSGLASCHITQHRKTKDGITTVTYRAVATDKAGNTRTRKGHYRIKH